MNQVFATYLDVVTLLLIGGKLPSGFWANASFLPECFAEVFDTSKKYWEPLPAIEFGRIPSDLLIVAPFGCSPQKIMLLNKGTWDVYLYDSSVQKWSLFHCDFRHHLCRMHGQPLPVKEMSTLYWLAEDGSICGYDWQAKKFFIGPIVGLVHELYTEDGFRSSQLILLHLMDDLFCLVWNDNSAYDVHLTILRVFKEDPLVYCSPQNRLTAVVVACVGYRFSIMFDILNAHPLPLVC